MNFDYTAEQNELRQQVAAFAKAELNAGLQQDDQAHRFSREKWKKAAHFGLHGMPMPEAFGGTERDLLTTACAMEGLGYGCRDNGLIFSINAHIWSAEVPLLRFGTQAQKDRYLPGLINGDLIGVHAMTEETSGSDAFNVKVTARKKGDRYVLNGAKTFITNGPVADVVIVFATVDPERGAEGISAFIVERGQRGFEAGNGFHKMGLRTSPMSQMFFDDCEVAEELRLGPEGAGMAIFNSSMDHERACILAANIGTMQYQLEQCIERARTWQRFGKPIGKFQSVSNRIADMTIRLETSRLLLFKGAWLLSQGRRATMESAMAKLYVSDCFVQSSQDAVQIFGGYGYVADYGVERDLRDAVGGTIYSGTNDIQRLIIARYKGL